jgi:O-antigen ligase
LDSAASQPRVACHPSGLYKERRRLHERRPRYISCGLTKSWERVEGLAGDRLLNVAAGPHGLFGMRAFPSRPSWSPVDLWVGVLGVLAAFGAAIAISGGHARLFAFAAVATAVFIALLRWPETVLMLWFFLILSDGRWLTYHKLGPLYVTEPLIALIFFALFLRFAIRSQTRVGDLRRRLAARPLTFLICAMWVPALVGLLALTSVFDYAAARNFALILYSLFALIIVGVTDLRNSYRRWFIVAVGGSTVALVIAFAGKAGPEAATSTGALRLAGFTFALAFGIAPIVLVAAAREGLIRPLHATLGALPFLVALILVNHRSAWLAFLAASAILFGKKFSAPVALGGIAALTIGYALLTSAHNNVSTVGQEITRAKTVFSTTDPNARFRLDFWSEAMRESVHSPIVGAGFDPYPASIVPPETVGDDPFPAPHNSFVAIAYRVGIIPFVIVLALLGMLIAKGFRASSQRDLPLDRAVCSALTAIVVYSGVTSAFNVFLEAPYAGPLFWTSVGLLAYAVYARPFVPTADEDARSNISQA